MNTGKLWPGMDLAAMAAGAGEVAVIVRYQAVADRAALVADVDGISIERHYRRLPYVAMRVSTGGLRRLQDDPTVERIWPDLPVRALLDRAAPLIHVPEVWALGATGKDVRIAIVDTGVDPNHPDLADRLVASADFTGEGPHDGHGHGTHVAGIAAGSGAASGGRYRGVAPGAALYSAKVLGADGSGVTSTVLAGLEWAAEQQVQVINLSLGTTGSSDGSDALSEACNTLVDQGYIVCAAAGNDGPGHYTTGSPGAAEQVITVGASTYEGGVAIFSSRGPTADDRIKPDILLPGVTITSCRAAGTRLGAVLDEHYTSASGTSMATPCASGLVALLLESEPGLRPAEVKDRLKRTAIDLGLSPYAQGAGLGDALRAYKDEVAQPPAEPPTPPPPEPARGCLALPAAAWQALTKKRE